MSLEELAQAYARPRCRTTADRLLDEHPYLECLFTELTPVGSKVTCNPPPEGRYSDIDFLGLHPDGVATEQIELLLADNGWVVGGSLPTDVDPPLKAEETFRSWVCGDWNLILTASPVFYQRFMAATSVCRLLNIQVKDDRVALFQAVLYGNATGRSPE